MRKLLTGLAFAALVVGLGAPAWGNGKAQSADQPITALGDRGHHGGHREGHGDHDGRRHGHGDHDGYRHDHGDYDRGYYRHGHYRDRYYYDRYYYDRDYYDGYYGCGYYPDCDPYYGGYYGGRRYYYDRYYDDDCYSRYRRDYRYRGDCGRSRYYDRGCGCYRTYGAEGAEQQSDANAPAAEPAPAADSPSPQAQH